MCPLDGSASSIYIKKYIWSLNLHIYKQNVKILFIYLFIVHEIIKKKDRN